MKAKKSLFGIIMIISIVAISCSVTKKSAISCTEFPVYKMNKPATNHSRNRNFYTTVRNKSARTNESARVSKKRYTAGKIAAADSESNIVSSVSGSAEISPVFKIAYSKSLIASSGNSIVQLSGNNWPAILISTGTVERYIRDTQVKCDTIVLKSGAIVIGKISEIGLTEIKYRKCDYQDGPVIVISKSIVSAIIYANGSSEAIISSNPDVLYSQTNIQDKRQTQQEGLGTVGFLAAILGLFVASIPLGILAVIFGTISLNKIKKDPARYKGKGLGVATVIIGLIDVLGMLIVLASMK